MRAPTRNMRPPSLDKNQCGPQGPFTLSCTPASVVLPWFGTSLQSLDCNLDGNAIQRLQRGSLERRAQVTLLPNPLLTRENLSIVQHVI